MNISIQYEAIYDYEEPASFSPHLARIIPRQDLYCHPRQMTFQAGAATDTQYRQDLFGNHIVYCFFPKLLKTLHFQLQLNLELRERNPFHFLLDSHAVKTPFQYKPEELRVLTPYLENRGIALPQALAPGTPKPTVETIMTLNTWLHENIAYERRDEGDAYPADELLQRGQGSCRDFTVLFAEVMRQHGVATRLASGYLWEPPEMAAEDRRAESALHAWVESYLPGAGWVGMDPTNGVLCDHHFIATAVGLEPADISPIAGHYYGKKEIASTLTTKLEITGA